MRISIAALMLSTICIGSALSTQAQTLVGTWQAVSGNRRVVLKVTEEPAGDLHGEIYYPGDERSGNTLNGNPVSSIEVDGLLVHFDLVESDGTFDGMLADNGDTLEGNWTASGFPHPLKFERATGKAIWVIDPSPHKVLFVPVERDVRLEVLDWGGSGPPLVLLAGNGNTAHVFDKFALNFTNKHHVYGITRRGFGLSSKPTPSDFNYGSDRLGDDVLAVIDALKLDRPVLAGHSLAGEELSSIGTRHPDRVRGLIYLDATYDYAYYNSAGTSDGINVDVSAIRRDLLMLFDNITATQLRSVLKDIRSTLPRLQQDLQRTSRLIESWQDPPMPPRHTLRDGVVQYISINARKYGGIKGPVLAIVAVPDCGDCDDPDLKWREANTTAQTDAFAAGTPQARVVRLVNARHYVFRSNEAEVVREMNAFMEGLR